MTQVPNMLEDKKTRIMRGLIVILLALAVLPLFSVVHASRPTDGSGSFTSTTTPVSVRMAGPNTIVHSTGSFTTTGTSVGTCTGTQDTISFASGRAITRGVCTFTGSINGSSGTVLFRFHASGQGSSFQGTFVLGDGSGGLAGVHGTGTFQGMGTSPTASMGTYTVRIH